MDSSEWISLNEARQILDARYEHIKRLIAEKRLASWTVPGSSRTKVKRSEVEALARSAVSPRER